MSDLALSQPQPISPARPLQFLYSGPAIPTTYDPQWQRYSNLTRAQIKAFQRMPEALSDYATKILNNQIDTQQFTHSSGLVVHPMLNGVGVKFVLPGGDSHDITPADIADAHSQYVARWQKCSAAHDAIQSDISEGVIKERSAIDAAFAAIS